MSEWEKYWPPDSYEIRAELAALPHALRCEATLDCAVITQGGPDGLRAHQMKVHFNDEWMWPDGPPRIGGDWA